MILSLCRARSVGALFLAAAALAAPSAHADDTYPSKPISIIVGYSAGGANDLLARLVGEKMSALLKQPVIVENKPGAGSIIGANFVAKAKPDGYTLLMGASGPISFNPALYKKLPYDPQKDLTPVSLVGTFPLVLVTQKSNEETRSLPGLIAYAKAHPGKSNYSASSASFQLITELFKRRTGTQFEYIPYKSSYESVMAVSTGDATITLADSSPAMQGISGGRVLPLAVTSLRFPARHADDEGTGHRFERRAVERYLRAGRHARARGTEAGSHPEDGHGRCRRAQAGGRHVHHARKQHIQGLRRTHRRGNSLVEEGRGGRGDTAQLGKSGRC